MSHVFISFSKDDREFAEEVSAKIKTQAGLDTWLYTERLPAGEHWRPAIDDAIKNCYALVLVLSPSSRDSQYVSYEWAMAVGLGKPVIPIMFRDTEDFHPKINDIEWEDFRQERPWGIFVSNLLKEVEAYTAYTIRVPREAPKVIHNTVALLESADREERVYAIEQLKQMSHPSIVPILIEALSYVTPDVRIKAAKALGEIKDNRGTQSLIKALIDPNWEIRAEAADSLGAIRDPFAVDPLLELLSDPVNSVKASAANALISIGDTRALQTVLDTFVADAALKEAFGQIDFIAKGLANYGLSAIPILCRYKEFKDDWTSLLIVETVGRIGGEEVIPCLLLAASKTDGKVRESAMKYLGRLHSSEATQIFISALNDQEIGIRQVAREMLMQIGTPEALKAVEGMEL